LTPVVLTLLTFLAAALAVAGAYSIAMDLFLRDRARVSQRLDEEFSNRQTGQIRRSPLFKNLEKLGPDVALAKGFRWSLSSPLRGMIEQSGLNLTLSRLFAICAGTGLVVGALGGFYTRSWLIGAGAGVVATGVPVLYVNFKRKRRLDKLLSQLPDAFDLIARLVRAGQTTSQAFQGVADEFEPPLSWEFAYCYEQQNLGLAPEVALRDMARRIELVEIRIFILAVLVQRQTGGNLAELIDNLSAIVRDRHALVIFLGVKMLLLGILSLSGFGAGVARGFPLMQSVLIGTIAGCIGMFLPDLWLNRQKGKRQMLMRRGLPDALDMIVICLRGGLSLQGAFQRVEQDLAMAHPELALEFSINLREIQLGRSTGEAMRHFADRCDLEEIRSLSSVILQSERLGASTVNALRVHAETLRTKRLQRAEEQAGKAGTKMVFPTILCIFPAILLVVIGPAVFQIMDRFSAMK
jgi:tight adherence protein B